MKKIVALVAVLFSVLVPVQSSSADQKSLVIIDSYFDSKVSAPNVKCIVVSTNSACTDVVTVSNPSISSEINHGNAMAEVAKKQNPSLSIVLLRSGVASARNVNPVNTGEFISALKWVDANSSSVGAVSFSRFINGPGTCSPASTPTDKNPDLTIRSLISSLKSKGVQVFASTGNKSGTKIDYPACISDVVSVTTGGMNKKGQLVSLHAFDANTYYFASLSASSYTSTVFKLIPQTTSSATVAVSAQYVTNGVLPSKVVNVLP